MATFNNINLEEASTTTHNMATVRINRGGTLEDQEILVVGDPESSLALAGVLNVSPASTQYGLVTRDINSLSQVDDGNGTTSTLAGDASFIGTGVDLEGFANVSVQLFADQGSASSGMAFEFSSDDTNWDDIYRFTMAGPSGGSRRFQFPVTAKYFRVNYTNGSTAQSAFRVQTLKHSNSILTSVHRLQDLVNEDRSAILVKSAIIAQKSGSTDTFTPVEATAGGNLKVSVEETAASTITAISSVSGRVLVDQNSTVWPVQVSSVAGTVQMTQVTSSGADITDSTNGSIKVTVVEQPANASTFVSGYLPSSAESTIVAAPGASSFIYVYAFSLTVNQPTSQTIRFLSGSTNELWQNYFNSSAISMGMVQSVTPPNHLFRCQANQSLAITSSGGQSTGVHYSVSYYIQPT